MRVRKDKEHLPSPTTLQEEIPLPAEVTSFIKNSRETIRSVLRGEDPRLLLIVGPCSIHDMDSTYEYAEKLWHLAKEVQESFFIVMRTYLEKPRTSLGWKGFLNDPRLDGSCDIVLGLRQSRRLLIDLAVMGMPVASELLEVNTTSYYSELLSWGCIGARTSTSQPHRALASSLPFPIGFKNPPDGNVLGAIHGILSANSPHSFLGTDARGELALIRSSGNPDCHLVLRGGEKNPNYDRMSLEKAALLSSSLGLHPSLIVDCSHDNCFKRHDYQIEAFNELLEGLREGHHPFLRGLMLESHLFSGSQPIHFPLRYGVSVTDPCLDFDRTKSLILKAHQTSLKRGIDQNEPIYKTLSCSRKS